MRDTQSYRISKFYPLTAEMARELREIGLHAAEWRLWSYLATFEPFGDEYTELPDLLSILAECNISKATFYRAIAKFAEHGLFDIQINQIQVRNLRGSKASHPCKKSLMGESKSLMGESKSLMGEKKSLMGETIPYIKETCNVEPERDTADLPKSTIQQSLKEQEQLIVSKSFNKEEQAMELKRLCRILEESGINPNKTIQETIAALIGNRSAAAAARLVENAISALREQQTKGTVRNPQGFVNAALKGGFTANGAIKARATQQQPKTDEPYGFPVEPVSLSQIEQSVDIALISGDRPFALGKLQQLWFDGWHDQLEELLILRKDWGFCLTTEGVT